MAIPTYADGQVLAALDCNTWFLPMCAEKPADTTRASNTTISADPDLTLPLVANSIYQVIAFINYEGSARGTADIQWSYAVPAGAVMKYNSIYNLISSGLPGFNLLSGATVSQAATGSSGVEMGLSHIGQVIMAGTTGSLTFSWAQNTSNAYSTKVRAQSYLFARRIA